MIQKNSLGCERKFHMNSSLGFICGVANAWGHEKLCPKCDAKLRAKWKEEDSIKMKGGNN